jgi:hypothetical protein
MHLGTRTIRFTLAALVLVTAALFGARVPAPAPVNACSCGPACDEIVPGADLIVEGRITGWEAAPEYERVGGYMPIRLHFDVVRVFKGSVPPDFVVADGTSLELRGERGSEQAWSGSGGACGSFDEDPTGLYMISALYWDERGYFRMGRLANPFIGAGPEGEPYESIVARLTQQVGPPVTGTAGARLTRGGHQAEIVLTGAILTIISGSLLLVTRRPV